MAQKANRADVCLWDRKAGLLEHTAKGYRFAYYPEYLSSKDAQPVSLTLPLTDKAYESASLVPFILGLIPEGWLLDIFRKRSERIFQ